MLLESIDCIEIACYAIFRQEICCFLVDDKVVGLVFWPAAYLNSSECNASA